MKNGRYWMFGSVDRDRMVERFVEGRMNDAELARFQTMLESDPQLRRMVETERAIRGTLLRDRNRLPADDPRGRAHLLAMLAAMPSGIESAGAAAGAAQGTNSSGASFLSGGIAKGIAVVVAGGIVTVGAIFGLRALESDNRTATPSAAQTHSQSASTPASTPAPEVTGVPTEAERVVAPASKPVVAIPPVVEQPEPTTSSTVSRNQHRQSQPSDLRALDSAAGSTTAAPDVQTQPQRTPIVIIPDTMRVDVMIEME